MKVWPIITALVWFAGVAFVVVMTGVAEDGVTSSQMVASSKAYKEKLRDKALDAEVERFKREGLWEKSSSLNEFTGKQDVYLATPALQPIYLKGREVRPVLHISCVENTTRLVVRYDGFLHNQSIAVRYRVDDRPPIEGRWSVSTDFQAAGLWNGNGSIPLVRQLMGAKSLLLEVWPYRSGSVTARFTVYALDNMIGDLRKACHW